MFIKLLSIILLFYSLTACKQVELSASDSGNQVDSVYKFEDKEEKLVFYDIQKQASSLKFLPQKHNNLIEIKANVVSWIKLIPSQVTLVDKNYILELNRATLDAVTAYIVTKESSWETISTGDSTPFGSRSIPHENFLFKISGQALKSVDFPIYLKIRNHAFTITSLNLWEEEAFNKQDREHSLFNGLYFGMFVALVIFNALIFLSVRDVSYLWYVAYLGFISLFLLAYSGFTYRYFWPRSPVWANYSTYFNLLIAMAMGLGFTRSILNMKVYYPQVASLLKWVGIGLALIALLGLLFDINFLSALIIYLALGIILLIALSVILAIRKGYKPAYYVGLSFLFLFIGVLIKILYKLEILPANTFFEYALEIGILLEAFLLSFTLAYRINYTNEALKQSRQKILKSKKQFATRLIEYQDVQRKETSETLHDSIGQKLLVMKIQLAQIYTFFNIPEDHPKVKSVNGLIHEVINDVRDVSHHLHPHQIDRLSLIEALEDLILQSFKESQIKHHYDFEGLEECIDIKSKLHIYRVIQELISNMLRHSAAKNVEFSSGIINGKLEIVVTDDGKGVFNKSWYKKGGYKKAYGIANIKERISYLKGNVKFISDKGMGLKIKIVLPCKSYGGKNAGK